MLMSRIQQREGGCQYVKWLILCKISSSFISLGTLDYALLISMPFLVLLVFLLKYLCFYNFHLA